MLLSDDELAFINAIYLKKETGKGAAATASGERRRHGSSSKGSICANDTQTGIFGKQQEQQMQQHQQQPMHQHQQMQSSNAAANVAAMSSSSPITPQPTDAVKARAKGDQQRQGLGTWL